MDDSHDRFLRAWSATQPVLAAYLMSLVGNHHVADDLIQEVAITCWKRFADYDTTRPFLPWALGIARIQVFSAWRARSRQPQALDEDVAANLEAETPAEEPALADRVQALRTCLEGLPEASRQVVQVVYGQDMEQTEAAERLGTSHGALRVRLTRLREVLRACIERRLRHEGSHD